MEKEDTITLRLLLIGILIFIIIASIPVLIFTQDRLRCELGLIAGGILAAGMVLHMNMVIQKSIYLEKNHSAYITANSIGRLLVMAALLGAAAYTGWVNVITMLIGIISLKVSALSQPLLKRLFYKNI